MRSPATLCAEACRACDCRDTRLPLGRHYPPLSGHGDMSVHGRRCWYQMHYVFLQAGWLTQNVVAGMAGGVRSKRR